jgi:hypothetical protein
MLAAQEYQLSKPLVKVEGNGFFIKKAKVILDFRLEGATLFYTLDGTEPTQQSTGYKKAINIRKSSTLKVRAFKAGFLPSETVTTTLHKLGERIAAVEITPAPAGSYAGNGAITLTDQQAGSLNFRDGQWLGYNEGPITVTLDLGKVKKTSEIIISTLTAAGSWIMPPESISTAFSADGQNFEQGPVLDIPAHRQTDPSGKTDYQILVNQKCRYIQLVITPLSRLPDWHPGKGNAGWVFLDEIIIH